jgi:hypothetical protein
MAHTATIQYGKDLERNLRAAEKRWNASPDKLAERMVRDAQVALDTFNETMSRLLLDTQAVA